MRYDDRLIGDLENAVGPGLVRLLGNRGATTRIDSGTRSPVAPPRPDPAQDIEVDDPSIDDSDDF